MLVVQLFVMKDGAFQGVEMAAGSRIVVGPSTADVPLEGVEHDGVVLTLRDGTLVASTFGAARVNGLSVVDGEVAPSHDVAIGAYAIKVRRMSDAKAMRAERTQQPASVPAPSAVEMDAVTVPAVPTVAVRAVQARASEASHAEAAASVELPVTELLAMGNTLPEPNAAPVLAFDFSVDAFLAADDEAEVDGDGDSDIDWSLVEQLARPPEGTGDLVEVIHARGELVMTHALLAASDAFDHGARPLVTRTGEGCRIDLPSGSLARTRRGGALAEIIAGDKPLTLSLARGDAATLSIDGAVLLVRFVARPVLALSADELRVQRLERKAHALCVSAGVSLCSLWVVALWIAEYRSRPDVPIQLPDDIERWPEVTLIMEPPKPVVIAKHVAPEPEPAQTPEASSPAKPAQRAVARVGSAKAPAGSPLDVMHSLPPVRTPSPSWEQVMGNVRQPIPGRPGGPILTGLIGKGPRGESIAGGRGLDTGVSSATLRGAGILEGKGERAIGAGVDRAKIGRLRTPPEAGLSKEAILRVINDHIGEIQVCYEKGLRGDASLGGRVVVEWIIGPNGNVTKARNETSTLAGNSVEDCMLSKIKTWTFPKANNASAVVYPFSFSSI